MDRLLCKVREEAGSEEPGEPKHVDTPGGYESGRPKRWRVQDLCEGWLYGIG